jgi:peptidyl-prolyl cis-trans isomerase SurA
VARSRLLPALCLLLCAAAVAVAQQAEPELVDRVVAVVDEDPILLTDIERVLVLGLVERRQGEGDDELRRRVLDGLIEQRLRSHEIGRFGFGDVGLEEVDLQVAALRAQFPDDQEFAARLERLGLDDRSIRTILARQIAILDYVEERLGPRVFVDLEEIRQYYEETLGPRLRAEGKPVPAIEEVREPIRAVLREQKLDQEIERWTAELRAQADVVDLLDQPERELPPEIDALTAPEP